MSWPSWPDEAAPLLVFSGAEVSAQEGHFLVYGLPSLDAGARRASSWPICSKVVTRA